MYTRQVYSKLKGTVPEVIDASGLLNITDNELTDYVAVIMLAAPALPEDVYKRQGHRRAWK